jgi:hypothetical protein
MKTLPLIGFDGDWRLVLEELRHTGEAIALEYDGTLCGVLLPPQEIAHVMSRYLAQAQRHEQREPARMFEELPTYLDLLRADPSLVPVVEGRPLEFLTMMNSSYIDPQQLYQFKHPKTGEIYIYRAGELQQAIGRSFRPAEFIPARPKDFVEGKQ